MPQIWVAIKNQAIWYVNPRLPEPFFVTQLPKGGGVVTTPPCDFEIYAHKVLLFTTIV